MDNITRWSKEVENLLITDLKEEKDLECGNDLEKLIELFQTSVNNVKDLESLRKLVRIVRKVYALNRYKLNPEQINKIAQLSIKVMGIPFCQESETFQRFVSCTYYSSHTLVNIFDHIKKAQETKSYLLLDNCCKWLSNHSHDMSQSCDGYTFEIYREESESIIKIKLTANKPLYLHQIDTFLSSFQGIDCLISESNQIIIPYGLAASQVIELIKKYGYMCTNLTIYSTFHMSCNIIEEILDNCPNLQTLRIHLWEIKDNSLKKLSILPKLKHLVLEGCVDLQDFSNISDLKNLESLYLRGCKNIKKFPGLCNMKKLVKIELDNMDLKEFFGFENLQNLVLKMHCCSGTNSEINKFIKSVDTIKILDGSNPEINNFITSYLSESIQTDFMESDYPRLEPLAPLRCYSYTGLYDKNKIAKVISSTYPVEMLCHNLKMFLEILGKDESILPILLKIAKEDYLKYIKTIIKHQNLFELIELILLKFSDTILNLYDKNVVAHTIISACTVEGITSNFETILQILGEDESILPVMLKIAKEDYDKYIKIILKYPNLLKFILQNSNDESLYPIRIKKDSNFKIYIKTIPDFPLNYPYQVSSSLSKMNLISDLNVSHYFEPGIDEGGLSRQFIEQLFTGLIINKDYLIFSKQHTGKHLITIVLNESTKCGYEINILIFIGFLLALILMSEGKYPIGDIFADGMYATLINLKKEEIKLNPFSLINSLSIERMIKLYEPLVDKPEEEAFNKLKSILFADEKKLTVEECNRIVKTEIDYFKKCGLVEEEVDIKNLDQFKKALFDSYQSTMISKIAPIHAIGYGIMLSMPFDAFLENGEKFTIKSWDQLSAIALSKQLQGFFNKSTLKKLIVVKGGSVIQNTHLANWIKEWIERQPEDLSTIKKVLQALTGASSTAENIIFTLSLACEGMEIHTCSSAISVPLNIDKDALMTQLDSWGRGEGVKEFTKP